MLTVSSADASAAPPRNEKPLSEVLKGAAKQALGGGLPGAAAMAMQVCALMWLRTTINYQYRHGTSTTTALKTLYKEGGVLRFYRGIGPALLQGPLSRFGDTAANAGMMAFWDSFDATRNMNTGLKTAGASLAAGGFRVFLMPIDALKTIMQVEGKNGLSILGQKMRAHGPLVLYHGALGAASATFVGHFPWFFTYNYLQKTIPRCDDQKLMKRVRDACIGFASSVVSDTSSNSLRVVKTTKQTFATPISYPDAVRHVVEKDGLVGLFGRGLKTRIIANGLQGALFSVLWHWVKELMK